MTRRDGGLLWWLGAALLALRLLLPAGQAAAPALVGAQRTPLIAVADSFIWEGYPSETFWEWNEMRAGYDTFRTPPGLTARSLVRFDLTALPLGATVTAARLRLLCHSAYSNAEGDRITVTAHRAAAAWEETSVTWENAPAPAEGYGSAEIVFSMEALPSWYEFDVTALAQAWYADSRVNDGVYLRGPELSGDAAAFCSFNTREGANPPQLVVDYLLPATATPTGVPPTATPTRTPSPTATALPPTATATAVPPTETATPSRTATPTDVPPTDTATPSPTTTATATPPSIIPLAPFLPLVLRYYPVPTQTPTPTPDLCPPVGVSYGTLSIVGAPSDRPAAQHADLNLARRGYARAWGYDPAITTDCAVPPDDASAPQLRGLFGDHRRPTGVSIHWVYRWDWDCNCPLMSYEDRWGPSLLRVATTPGETLHVPASGYSIDDAQGYEVLVLYAAPTRITLKYTREDNVVRGYTLHLEDICVDANLLALYEQMNAAGRANLPALRAMQPFAHAPQGTVGLVIRDNGNWMNPRHCADWWRT